MLTGGVDTVGNLALGADTDLQDTYDAYAIMADDLRAYGINMDLGPVVDVLLNKDNLMNHVRSFGADPEAVAARGVQAVRGLQDNGVVACPKHFPGKGDTPVDSHKAAPLTGEDRPTLEKTILLPFHAAVDAGADSIMINHEIYTALDPGVVATVSAPVITDLLKKDMGFQGLVITDSITMGGVTNTMDKTEAAYLSLKAGADMILFAGDSPDSYVDSIALLKRKLDSGELSMARVDDAVLRILKVKKKYGLFHSTEPTPADQYKVKKKANLRRSREIARNTITLIKDPDKLLPLDRSRAGPHPRGHSRRVLHGSPHGNHVPHRHGPGQQVQNRGPGFPRRDLRPQVPGPRLRKSPAVVSGRRRDRDRLHPFLFLRRNHGVHQQPGARVRKTRGARDPGRSV